MNKNQIIGGDMRTAEEIIKETKDLALKYFRGGISFTGMNPAEQYEGVSSYIFELCMKAIMFEEEMKLKTTL